MKNKTGKSFALYYFEYLSNHKYYVRRHVMDFIKALIKAVIIVGIAVVFYWGVYKLLQFTLHLFGIKI
jgi:hypothetical protein